VVEDNEPVSLYELPYSVTGESRDWHRLWINTATLSGAFVGTLLVLECLPEDATSWNRAELQDVPLFKRWHNHVFKKGPEWDHDKFYFNYLLHPYAGAAYFMAARSCGFNFWRSALYGSVISTVGWEFGIEAFMERPSIQDIFITPIVGSCIGEGFYHTKRWLVDNDYRLFGLRSWAVFWHLSLIRSMSSPACLSAIPRKESPMKKHPPGQGNRSLLFRS